MWPLSAPPEVARQALLSIALALRGFDVIDALNLPLGRGPVPALRDAPFAGALIPLRSIARPGLSCWVRGALYAAVISLACGAWPVAALTAPPDESDQPAAAVGGGAEPQPPNAYLGRQIAPPMHFSGAGWLTRPSRQREEAPGKMLRSLKIKPGQTVCDFGCGNGYHTLQLAKRVGPQGVVYAVDIQPEMLELLQQRAGPRGLQNIKPVLANAEASGLPPTTFDLVLMVDVYHELSAPAEVLAEVRASLKPAGRLVLVEFREEDPDVPILPLHKMSQNQVLKELTANGFKLCEQFDGLPWQHVLHFARDDSPLKAAALMPWQPPE